jgi:hypothetical protein
MIIGSFAWVTVKTGKYSFLRLVRVESEPDLIDGRVLVTVEEGIAKGVQTRVYPSTLEEFKCNVM